MNNNIQNKIQNKMNPNEVKVYDLIGIGLGPFQLSLAALSQKCENLQCLFLEKKEGFSWHQKLMFPSAVMQTTYLKDLVTPIDPTSPYSFLNYLVKNNLFYPFIHSERKTISRPEFELYCQWVCKELKHIIKFQQDVKKIHYHAHYNLYEVITRDHIYWCKNISLGTGVSPKFPSFVNPTMLNGPEFFTAQSILPNLHHLKHKRVIVVGGGQTGLELMQTLLHQHKEIHFKSLTLITRRSNLRPLEEGPFVNDFFTPHYGEHFFHLPFEERRKIIQEQKLCSDGNTPSDLKTFYQALYHHLISGKQDEYPVKIAPGREVLGLEKNHQGSIKVKMSHLWDIRQNQNNNQNENEILNEGRDWSVCDVVIFSLGLKVNFPELLMHFMKEIEQTPDGEMILDEHYAFQFKNPHPNRGKIYGLNRGLISHGIADPQTSLMAHRSWKILQDIQSSPQTSNKTSSNHLETVPTHSFQSFFYW
jgi:lysine N6-hydroxylase